MEAGRFALLHPSFWKNALSVCHHRVEETGLLPPPLETKYKIVCMTLNKNACVKTDVCWCVYAHPSPDMKEIAVLTLKSQVICEQADQSSRKTEGAMFGFVYRSV